MLPAGGICQQKNQKKNCLAYIQWAVVSEGCQVFEVAIILGFVGHIRQKGIDVLDSVDYFNAINIVPLCRED